MTVIVDREKCISCAGCVSVCPVSALLIREKYPLCDSVKCTNCKICIKFCPAGALSLAKKE